MEINLETRAVKDALLDVVNYAPLTAICMEILIASDKKELYIWLKKLVSKLLYIYAYKF